MIRRTWNSDKWLLTPQAEHARLASIIAASWKFPGEKPHDEVFKAILTHDDGWKDTDAQPPLKADGDPRDFLEMPLSDSVAIFDKSIQLRKESGQTFGAALVAGHFLKLVESADLARASTEDAKDTGRFIARTRQALAGIMQEVQSGKDGDALVEQFDTYLRFLRVCDYLSLLLCGDFRGEETLKDVPFLSEGDTLTVSRNSNKLALTLSPLPFKKNLRDHLTSYIVPIIPYESSEELAAAMDEVKVTKNEVHFGAGNG